MILDSLELAPHFVAHQILTTKEILSQKPLNQTSGYPVMKMADPNGGGQESFQKLFEPDLTVPALIGADVKRSVKEESVISS